MTFVVVLFYVLVLVSLATAFLPSPSNNNLMVSSSRASSSLDACRRNNKLEKRKRNKDYARKFQSKLGPSRRKVVIDEKRAVVAGNEEKFVAQLFKFTTEEDMPAYSGFDFA